MTFDRSTPRKRAIPVGWQSAPLDMQAQGIKGMIVIHMPVRREFNAAQRAKVENAVVDAALQALLPLETDPNL